MDLQYTPEEQAFRDELGAWLDGVLPDGEILTTGSRCMPKAGDFWEYGPGPDLMGLQRSGLGTNGIVTEITVKLHAWVGDESFPEFEGGRPSLAHVHDAKYDNQRSHGWSPLSQCRLAVRRTSPPSVKGV